MRKWFAMVFLVLVGSTCWAQDAAPEPTAQHKILAKEVGQWEGVMKAYMDPNGPPMEMSVVETNVLLDGGLWLLSEFDAGPFKGRGQFGFDPDKKKFIGTWLDNQTTALSLMEGTYDEKTGELTYLSTVKNPATGADTPTKQISKFVNDNQREFVAYMQNADGKTWDKWMEISYKRKK
ncbi:MAG: DUF1579 domain-containing protein [Planctomycetaceae bacterium]|nr:DUF1579 domain-containing protein [Planctomycetaceae bacterium]